MYTSLPKSLMKCFVRDKVTVAISEHRAYLGMWIGSVVVLFALGKDGTDESWIPESGGLLLSYGTDVGNRRGQDNLCVLEKGSPGYLETDTGAEPASIHVFPG